MNRQAKVGPAEPAWQATDGPPEPGHDEYVREAIAEGLEDIRAGRVSPIEQVWKELGLE